MLALRPGAAEAGHSSVRLKATQYSFGEKSWSATLVAGGRLTVEVSGERRVFALSKSQLSRLEDLVNRERFFELADSYGQQERHVDFRSVELVAGGRSKTVVIYGTLGHELRTDDLRRALRVAIAIRDLFDWPGALDTRDEDEKLIRSLAQ
jgi:hypothetical protein